MANVFIIRAIEKVRDRRGGRRFLPALTLTTLLTRLPAVLEMTQRYS